MECVQALNAERRCIEQKQKAQREHDLCGELQVACSASSVLIGGLGQSSNRLESTLGPS